MSEELVAKREKYWWEHYPLHQLWCNDACPLVPRFEYRKGDEWNANNWSLHWLIFHIWTLEHFSFGVDANLQSDSISLGQLLRRRPALKNERGEYN